MKLVISRTYEPSFTLGGMFVLNGHELVWKCKCIELPWLNNQKMCSCIPGERTYDVIKYDSPSKGKVFWIQQVPERDYVYIHIGNYVAGKKVDSLGCILPGLAFQDANDDGFLDVVDSTKAMNKLLSLLPEKFKLTIL